MLEGICEKLQPKIVGCMHSTRRCSKSFLFRKLENAGNTTFKKAISPINSIASSHQNLSPCDGQRLSFQSIRHRKYHPTQHVTNLTKKAYPSRILCPPASQTFFPIYPCKHTHVQITELVRHCHTALT